MKTAAAPLKEGPRINRDIRARDVQLIDAEGKNHGAIPIQDALTMAEEAGLDLVEIAPNAEPPVCKILDFGKYKYELQKKKAEAKKKQKVVEVKEIQLRPMINPHDFGIKCKAIQRFIEEGNKVKIIMRFRGRELSHQNIGYEILMKVKTQFEEVSKVDHSPKLEGKQMIMIISPK